MILLDASGLFAAISEDQRDHLSCWQVITEARPPLLLSPFVAAEVDYLVSSTVGVDTELRFIDDIVSGAYQLVEFSSADVEEAREVISRYRRLNIGLADASIVVLSRKFNELDVFTLDHRHFRALRGSRGQPFRILP